MFENGEFLIASGFVNDWSIVTKNVYKLDTTVGSANWVRQDDIISPDGISHTGFAFVGQKFYVCGGYIGKNPGPNTGTLLCIMVRQPFTSCWLSSLTPPPLFFRWLLRL